MSIQLLENRALSRGIIGKSAPILAEITIRKSQALILDQVKLAVFIAPVKDAEKFIGEQWPQQPLIRMSKEELVAKISIVQKNIQQSREIEVIQRRIEEQYALVEALQRWLDKQLKN